MRRFTTLAILMAVGMSLQWVESALMLPSPLPGAKLGLANVATLVVLARYGGRTAAAFTLVRHLAASLLTGGWFLPTFWLGMAGSLATALLLALLGHHLTLRTASVLSGAAFQAGQSAALLALTTTFEMIAFLPPLLAIGVGAGWATGHLAFLVERSLRPGWRDTPAREHLVAGSLLAVSLAAGLLLQPPADSAREAIVTVAGEERMRLDLSRPGEYPLAVAGGNMIIQVQTGRVRVIESDCEDQVCVLTGWVDLPGRPIYCAPYRTLITVKGGSAEIDGLLR